MDHDKLAAAFNRWMDDFVNDPEAFSSTTGLALQHAKERNEGKPLTYGQTAAATLTAYLEKIA